MCGHGVASELSCNRQVSLRMKEELNVYFLFDVYVKLVSHS